MTRHVIKLTSSVQREGSKYKVFFLFTLAESKIVNNALYILYILFNMHSKKEGRNFIGEGGGGARHEWKVTFKS